jgi:hypothetical protein
MEVVHRCGQSLVDVRIHQWALHVHTRHEAQEARVHWEQEGLRYLSCRSCLNGVLMARDRWDLGGE